MRLLMQLPRVKLTRRRMVLMLVGLAWLSYGFGVLTDPFPEARFGHVISFLTAFLDSHYTGAVWLAGGAAAILAALAVLPEALGFQALVVPPVMWGGLYLWSWVTSLIAVNEGSGRGWVSATAWLAIALMISVIAGWPDDERPPR